MKKIKITLYTWAGKWGPFRIKISCGECGLTKNIILDVLKKEFPEQPITLTVKEWLPNWWRVLPFGGWHAPIVMVGNKVISQGKLLNRTSLSKILRKRLGIPENIPTIINSESKTILNEVPQGNVLFHQPNCSHCKRAKELLTKNNIYYTGYDVIDSTERAQQMLTQTKKHIGKRSAVTTPQIWLNSKYIGGADELEVYVRTHTTKK